MAIPDLRLPLSLPYTRVTACLTAVPGLVLEQIHFPDSNLDFLTTRLLAKGVFCRLPTFHRTFRKRLPFPFEMLIQGKLLVSCAPVLYLFEAPFLWLRRRVLQTDASG